MAQYKDKNCKYLIVMGCLVQRYYNELIKALPEVDLFIKLEEYDNLWQKIEDLIQKKEFIKLKDNNKGNKRKIKQIPMFKSKNT